MDLKFEAFRDILSRATKPYIDVVHAQIKIRISRNREATIFLLRMLFLVTSVVYHYKCSRVHAREKEISQATKELETVPVNVDLSTYSCIVAQGGDKVYRDECVFCFNSAVSFKQVFHILLHSAFEKKITIRITKK